MITQLLFVVIFHVFTYFLGSKLFSLFNLKLRWYEHVLFSISIGTLTTALSIFMLGVAGLLYDWLFFIIFIVVIALSYREIQGLLSVRLPLYSLNINTFFFILLFLLMATNFLMSLAPIFEVDSISYHLPIASEYASQHEIVQFTDNVYGYWSHGLSMLYVIPESFNLGGQASVLIASSLGAFAALSIAAVTARFFSEKASGFAAFLFYSLPMVIERSSQSMIDLPMAFFSTLSFFALLMLLTQNKHQKQWVILFAIFAGIQPFFKLGGILVLLALLLGFFYVVIQKRSLLPTIGLALIVMILTVVPWYLWVFANTGDPIYPYLADFTKDPAAVQLNNFIGEWIDAQRVGTTSGLPIFSAERWLQIFLLPITMTFKPALVNSFIGLTPLFLIFLPLALLPRFNKKKETALAVLMFLSYVVLWQFPNPDLRYVIPGFALISAPTAYIMLWLSRKSIYRNTIIIVVVLMLGFSSLLWAGMAAQRIPGAIGVVSDEDYLANKADINPILPIKYMNQNLPDDAYVAFFKETRGYLLERDYFVTDPFYQQVIDFNKIESSQELKTELQNLGITHILFAKADIWAQPLPVYDHALPMMRELSEGEPLYEDEHFIVLELQ